MSLPALTIKSKFILLVLMVVAGFGAFGAITYNTVNKIKVTGPVYADIVTGKDIVADILPPPEYIIESYLTALQLTQATESQEINTLEAKMTQLEKDFEDRQTYWQANLPEGEMKNLMLGACAEPAREFYTLAKERFIPMLHDGKQAEAAALLNGEMRAAYGEHRASVDRLVTLAVDFSKAAEGNATSALASGATILTSVAVTVLTFLVIVSVFLARSVLGPTAAMNESIADIQQSNDLTKRVAVKSKDEIGRLGTAFNGMIQTLHDIIAEVKSGSAQIDAGGMQIASASQSLAEGASEQASSLEEIAASLEQMSSQTQQSSENANQANALSEESKKSADRGQQEMVQMSKAVNEIKQSSGEISKIIKVIDEIAFQTNLLALNAAVEAARAGEAGKGFAVVAEEVRSLAQRSAEAAKNTSTMIEESVKRSENGVQIVARVGQALQEITSSTNKVNALLAEIASASSEQATGIGQVNQGVGQLDQVTQQNAGNSEELASSAEEMSSQVASLNEIIARFKVDAATGGSHSKKPGAKHSSTHAPMPSKRQATSKAAAKPAAKPSKMASGKSTAAETAEAMIPLESDDQLASF